MIARSVTVGVVGFIAITNSPTARADVSQGTRRFDHVEFKVPGDNVSVAALSQNGLVAGTSKGPGPGSNAAFITDAGGDLTDIDQLDFDSTVARAVNDAGQVAGIGCTLKGNVCANAVFRFSRATGTQNLGGLPGGSAGDATDINEHGDIVGSWIVDNETSVAHAFLFTDEGGMQDLGTLGGQGSSASAVNDARQVVGQSRYDVLPSQSHAFLWQSGVMTDLGSMGGPTSAATDINESGTIVGWALDAQFGSHAFIYTQAIGMLPLPLPKGAVHSAALAVNEVGMILVSYTRVNDESGMAVVTPEGQVLDIPLLEGFQAGSAFAMNIHGHVVGGDILVQGSEEIVAAFYWSPQTGVLFLDDLVISDLPWAIFSPIAINDNDQILVHGFDANGEHSALLRPALPGDVNGDRSIDIDDIFGVIAAWGACPKAGGCPADLDSSGGVGIDDLFEVVLNWP